MVGKWQTLFPISRDETETDQRTKDQYLLPQLPAIPLSILCAAVYTGIWRLTAYLQMPSMAFEKDSLMKHSLYTEPKL